MPARAVEIIEFPTAGLTCHGKSVAVTQRCYNFAAPHRLEWHLDPAFSVFDRTPVQQAGRQAGKGKPKGDGDDHHHRALKARLKYQNLDVAGQLTAGLSGKLYSPPEDETWWDAWAVTEALMARAAESSQKMGARFVLATLSNPMQVTPDLAIRAAAEKELGVGDLYYPDRRLAKFGRDSGFEVITLAERLAARATVNNERLHGRKSFFGGHWNETGHRVAGEILAQELCDILR